MDITYVRQDGNFEVFHYLADGNRPVLNILVDTLDQIWIAAVEPPLNYVTNTPQLTKGVAHRHTDEVLQTMGVTLETVCLQSIAAYIVPRIGTMMARVYCPNTAKNSTE
jgi:hypothetical protein